MRSKYFLLICCIFLLASCESGAYYVIKPPLSPLQTVTPKPTCIATVTVTPGANPTPGFYPAIDSASLPPTLRAFLDRYDSFEDMNAKIQKDYRFIAIEVNGRPSGTRDTSPLLALEKGITDCYETAVISALFGEKFSYKPYLLILEHPVLSKKQPHSIHVFQDPLTGLWGYNDYMLELQQPVFSHIEDLANAYIKNHPVEGRYYDFWNLVDLTKVKGLYDIDWRTTTRNLRITDKLIINHGVYLP